MNRVLEIIHNLKDKENEDLRIKVMEGKITCEELATIDLKNLVSKKILEKEEKKKKEIFEGMQSDWTQKHLKVNEGSYTCRKCGGKKTTHQEMQTRSADEPMTIFITCVTCGNQWKI